MDELELASCEAIEYVLRSVQESIAGLINPEAVFAYVR
jgi:hypothetical protein